MPVAELWSVSCAEVVVAVVVFAVVIAADEFDEDAFVAQSATAASAEGETSPVSVVAVVEIDVAVVRSSKNFSTVLKAAVGSVAVVVVVASLIPSAEYVAGEAGTIAVVAGERLPREPPIFLLLPSLASSR